MSIKLINKSQRVIVLASQPSNIMCVPTQEVAITESQYLVLKQLTSFEGYVNKGEMQVIFDAPVPELKKNAEPVKVVEESVEVKEVEQVEAESEEVQEEKPKRRGRRKKG